MKVNFPIADAGSYAAILKGKKQALLPFLNALVHTLAAAKQLQDVFVAQPENELTVNFPPSVQYILQFAADNTKDTMESATFLVADLPAIKAARRIVAAKVLGVAGVSTV